MSCQHWKFGLEKDILSISINPSIFLSLSLPLRDEIQMKSYSRTNGQPKSPLPQSPPLNPSSHSHPVSVSTRPGHACSSVGSSQSPVNKPGGGVKKVTGVGGTTYEISVWVMGSSLTSPVSTAEPWTCLLCSFSQSRDSLHCWKRVAHNRRLWRKMEWIKDFRPALYFYTWGKIEKADLLMSGQIRHCGGGGGGEVACTIPGLPDLPLTRRCDTRVWQMTGLPWKIKFWKRLLCQLCKS